MKIGRENIMSEIQQKRQYRRAKGQYFLLNKSQTSHDFRKVIQDGFNTKFLAEKKALEILDDVTNMHNTLYIEQVEYERVDLHEGAPCPWCNNDTLVLVPEQCLVVEYLVCTKCDSKYETGNKYE